MQPDTSSTLNPTIGNHAEPLQFLLFLHITKVALVGFSCRDVEELSGILPFEAGWIVVAADDLPIFDQE